MIILSAGASTRMGFPKALAKLPSGHSYSDNSQGARSEGVRPENDTLLEAHLRPRHLGLAGVKAVLGARGAYIAQRIDRQGAEIIHHSRWEEGQSSSLRAGLLTLPLGEHTFVTPVDCPPVSNRIISAMLEATHGEWDVIQPTFEGKTGHPVLLSSLLIQRFLAEEPPPPLNQFLREHAPLKRIVEVHSASILWNLNRPEDLLSYQRTFEG